MPPPAASNERVTRPASPFTREPSLLRTILTTRNAVGKRLRLALPLFLTGSPSREPAFLSPGCHHRGSTRISRVSTGEGMTTVNTTKSKARRLILGALLVAAAGGLLTACSSMPPGPTYTDEELRAICERHGGWWRGNLIPGYCEYQLASHQAP